MLLGERLGRHCVHSCLAGCVFPGRDKVDGTTWWWCLSSRLIATGLLVAAGIACKHRELVFFWRPLVTPARSAKRKWGFHLDTPTWVPEIHAEARTNPARSAPPPIQGYRLLARLALPVAAQHPANKGLDPGTSQGGEAASSRFFEWHAAVGQRTAAAASRVQPFRVKSGVEKHRPGVSRHLR
jgi:hypothetical protein